MTDNITLRALSECIHCGMTRAAVDDEAHAAIIQAWVSSNVGPYEEHIRDYQDEGEGFSFAHGGNYPIVDMDLLGGTGDGLTESKFASETGMHVVYPAGSAEHISCEECSKFIRW